MSVLVDHEVERGRLFEIQEMTFTRWCNSALNRRGSPLIDDIFIGMICFHSKLKALFLILIVIKSVFVFKV